MVPALGPKNSATGTEKIFEPCITMATAVARLSTSKASTCTSACWTDTEVEGWPGTWYVASMLPKYKLGRGRTSGVSTAATNVTMPCDFLDLLLKVGGAADFQEQI